MTRAYIPLLWLDVHLASGWRVLFLLPARDEHPITRPAGAVCER